MSVTSTETDTGAEESQKSRRQLLQLARRLDRFGAGAEEFLTRQCEQLERCIEEFEREKSAWRRQLRRESRKLVCEREHLEQLRDELSADVRRTESLPVHGPGKDPDAVQARAHGTAGIRILLSPNEAGPRQVGLLLFEISKLNREMGGRGLTYDLTEVRIPGRRLFRRCLPAATGRILEITGTSVVPLAARGTHVSLDVDISDRVEVWIAFKTRLLQARLTNDDLAVEFRKGSSVTDHESGSVLREAVQHVDAGIDAMAYSSGSLFPYAPLDSVRQQLERLEGCCESLRNETGLLVHIDLQNYAL